MALLKLAANSQFTIGALWTRGQMQMELWCNKSEILQHPVNTNGIVCGCLLCPQCPDTADGWSERRMVRHLWPSPDVINWRHTCCRTCHAWWGRPVCGQEETAWVAPGRWRDQRYDYCGWALNCGCCDCDLAYLWWPSVCQWGVPCGLGEPLPLVRTCCKMYIIR